MENKPTLEPNQPEKFFNILQGLYTQLDPQALAKIQQNDQQQADELDKKAKEEQQREKALANDHRQATIDKFNEDNKSRRAFSEAILTITVFWMLAVLLIFYQTGKGVLHFSDSVLITLLTTTTANVFGFLYVIVNYLFNKDKST